MYALNIDKLLTFILFYTYYALNQNVSKWIFKRKVSSITCGSFDSDGFIITNLQHVY